MWDGCFLHLCYNEFMKIKLYGIESGKLQPHSAPVEWGKFIKDNQAEYWVHIDDTTPTELGDLLTQLDLHPLLRDRCLDQVINPGVFSYNHSILMEYPAAFDRNAADPAYLTILLKSPFLITVQHGSMPTLDELIQELSGGAAPEVHHLAQVIYLILDQFTDLNVDAEVEIRDQLVDMAKTLSEHPAKFDGRKLANLRWQVENLVSMIENQLYCISGLAASDLDELQEPHRKAYIQDLQTEAEIAQRGVYRLENRVNDLYNDYQMLGSDRVERRLRLLTIVSAVTLPLGLITGMLGMNVGGVPGIDNPAGFIIVLVFMVIIAMVLFGYFKQKGWFD
jgi:Mg2+ and Co2+ transporter CorA